MTAGVMDLQTGPVTPPAPPSVPTPLPVRAKLLILKQRIVLSIRFWFRLPSDDMRDAALSRDLSGLLDNQTKLVQMLDTQAAMIKDIGERLQYYEEKMPRLRDLKRQREKVKTDRHEHGIIGKLPLS